LFTGRRWDILNNGSLKIQYSRNRYYDHHTGRFLTEDPLGITPNPPKPNIFNVTSQYKDELSLYEYVRSNPVSQYDSFGLACSGGTCGGEDSEKAGPVCCKITITYPGTPYNRYGPIPYIPTHSKCTQQTTYSECTPETACCAAYKDNKKIKVYDWHEGQCCWCTIYITTESWVVPRIIPFHKSISVVCEQGRGEWSASVGTGVGIDEGSEGKMVDLDLSNEAADGHNKSIGRISCDSADDWKGKFGGMQWYYKWPGNDCWGFASRYARKMSRTCP